MASVLNDFPAAKRLVGKSRSSLELISHLIHIPLPNEYLADLENAMLLILKDELEIYSSKLGGVPVAFNKKSARFINGSGYMISAQSRVHCDLICEFIVFKPKVTDILNGVVTKIADNTIGCLVHGCFYTTIQPKLKDSSKITNLKIGDKITFKVTKLGEDGNGVLSINGGFKSFKSKKIDEGFDVSETILTAKPEPMQYSDSGFENTCFPGSFHSNHDEDKVLLTPSVILKSNSSLPEDENVETIKTHTRHAENESIEMIAENDIMVGTEKEENILDLSTSNGDASKKKKKKTKKKHKKEKRKKELNNSMSESVSECNIRKEKKKLKKAKKSKKEKHDLISDSKSVNFETGNTISSSINIDQQTPKITEISSDENSQKLTILPIDNTPTPESSNQSLVNITDITLTPEQEIFIRSLGDIMQDKKDTPSSSISTPRLLTTVTSVTIISSDKEINNLNPPTAKTNVTMRTKKKRKGKLNGISLMEDSTSTSLLQDNRPQVYHKNEEGSVNRDRESSELFIKSLGNIMDWHSGDSNSVQNTTNQNSNSVNNPELNVAEQSSSTKKTKKRKHKTEEVFASPPKKRIMLDSSQTPHTAADDATEMSEHQQQALFHLQKLGIKLPLSMLSTLPVTAPQAIIDTDSDVFLSPSNMIKRKKKKAPKTDNIASESSFASPVETSTPMLPQDKLEPQTFSYQDQNNNNKEKTSEAKVKKIRKTKKKKRRSGGGTIISTLPATSHKKHKKSKKVKEEKKSAKLKTEVKLEV